MNFIIENGVKQMNDLFIYCRLQENETEPTLMNETVKWLDKNIPEIDYSSIFDIEGYIDDKGDWVNSEGCIGLGDEEFWDESGSNTLDEDSIDYEIAYLENYITSLKYYILLSELEEKQGLDEIGITSFDINDGSQFGYNKKLEYARIDLVESENELTELKTKQHEQSPISK